MPLENDCVKIGVPVDNDSMTVGFPGITFWATPILRIVMRLVGPGEAGVFINGRKPVLQQVWQGSDGSAEWRDVPVVDEP